MVRWSLAYNDPGSMRMCWRPYRSASTKTSGLCRMRTESLAVPSPRAGKRFSDARDRRLQTASLQRLEADLFTPAKSRVFGERSPIERVFGATKNGHRKSALAARSPGAWPRRAVKPPRRIAARRKRDGGYAPCPNPAVTLCRKDWISCVNRAVLCPLRTPACPGIPPRRLHGPR
jgi:hypothetical protein